VTSPTSEAHRCWPLAVHEAAHAVLGVLFGLRLERIEIDLRTWQGATFFEGRFPPSGWRQDLLVSLAGEIAQRRADPSGWSLGNGIGRSRAAADLEQAWRAVGRSGHPSGSEDHERFAEARMAEGQLASAALVNKLWPTIAALAERLLEANGRLERDALETFLESAFPIEQRAAVAAACAA
jgi:hypothetical protein